MPLGQQLLHIPRQRQSLFRRRQQSQRVARISFTAQRMPGRCLTPIRTVPLANPSMWRIPSMQQYYSTIRVRFIIPWKCTENLSVICEGPSIMVRTVTSSTGGVFAVWIDGFDTNSTIDTFSLHGNQVFPVCYPVQFPPFVITPPEFGSHSDHTIKLVYVGTSKFAPAGANTSNLKFDSFAIPIFESMTSGGTSPSVHTYIVFFFFLSVYLTQ